MRQRSVLWVLGSVLVVGGVLAACGGSDSSGPSGVACTGNTPDLAGTWTLDTLEFVPGGVDPGATGSFLFTGDSVYVTLNVTGVGAITGAGKCTLTATKLYIDGSGAIGQASGSYAFVDAATDTLHASLVPAQNQTIRVVVTR